MSCVVQVTTTSERYIRLSLSQEAANMLVCSIVQSRIDYCNSLQYVMSECNLNRLQCLQNKLASVVCSSNQLRNVNDIRRSLHWLPIRRRINIKVAVIKYKLLAYDIPYYICDQL